MLICRARLHNQHPSCVTPGNAPFPARQQVLHQLGSESRTAVGIYQAFVSPGQMQILKEISRCTKEYIGQTLVRKKMYNERHIPSCCFPDDISAMIHLCLIWYCTKPIQGFMDPPTIILIPIFPGTRIIFVISCSISVRLEHWVR